MRLFLAFCLTLSVSLYFSLQCFFFEDNPLFSFCKRPAPTPLFPTFLLSFSCCDNPQLAPSAYNFACSALLSRWGQALLVMCLLSVLPPDGALALMPSPLASLLFFPLDEIVSTLGEGTFGRVVQCIDHRR